MTGGSRTRGPAARLPPVDRRAASAISACVKLVSCKFCTKNCYFSLFFFVVGGFVVVFFFFFSVHPRPSRVGDRARRFQGEEVGGIRMRQGVGSLGTAATFSSTCGSLPNCATEEIFIFHTRKCVVGRDFILTSPLPPGKKEVGGR